jgi:PAS domain S-box-containing protein
VSVPPDSVETSGLFEAALEALALPVLLHDEDRVIFANASAREFLGAATRADIEGLPLDTFVVPDMEAVTQERRAYLMRDRVAFPDVPIKMRTLDGRTVRLTVAARPIAFEGRTLGLVTLAR